MQQPNGLSQVWSLSTGQVWGQQSPEVGLSCRDVTPCRNRNYCIGLVRVNTVTEAAAWAVTIKNAWFCLSRIPCLLQQLFYYWLCQGKKIMKRHCVSRGKKLQMSRQKWVLPICIASHRGLKLCIMGFRSQRPANRMMERRALLHGVCYSDSKTFTNKLVKNVWRTFSFYKLGLISCW